MINRDNYEEYFLLFLDNELSLEERNAVEEFINENADLRGELLMLQQLRLKPEQNIFFGDKDMLFKRYNENSIINHNNYEEYFLLYADSELSADGKRIVKEFGVNNPVL